MNGLWLAHRQLPYESTVLKLATVQFVKAFGQANKHPVCHGLRLATNHPVCESIYLHIVCFCPLRTRKLDVIVPCLFTNVESFAYQVAGSAHKLI